MERPSLATAEAMVAEETRGLLFQLRLRIKTPIVKCDYDHVERRVTREYADRKVAFYIEKLSQQIMSPYVELPITIEFRPYGSKVDHYSSFMVYIPAQLALQTIVEVRLFPEIQ